MKKYKFSVIIAVYNVQDYIDEAMASIINQTIGFENIQVIMVDDCSADDSARVCEKYQKLYPDNVMFIPKEQNTGAADTRNAAIEFIQGELTTVIDPDDYIDLDLFEKVYKYYGEVQDEVDVVAVPLQFFEASRGYHICSKYNFHTTRVIDIEKEWYNIQVSVCGTFVKSDIFKKYRYPVDLIVDSEDCFLISQIILDKKKYAVLKDQCVYHYRKRMVKNSLTQTNGDKKEWYIDKIHHFHFKLMDLSKQKYGTVLKYIQFLCFYTLQWNIKYNYGKSKVLSKEETDLYLNLVHELLLNIDDDIIVNQRGDKKLTLSIHFINFLIKIKYGADTSKYFYRETNVYKTLGNSYIYSLREHGINITIIEIKNQCLHIAGYNTNPFEGSGLTLKLYLNNEEADFVKFSSSAFQPKYFGKGASECTEFVCDIPLNETGLEINQIYFTFENEWVKHRVPLILKKYPYSKLFPPNKYSYYIKDNIEVYIRGRNIWTRKVNASIHLRKEVKLLYRLIFGPKLARRKRSNYKSAILRILYWITYPLYHGAWIFMDRADKGGDNAEFLFRYSIEQQDHIKKYFIINKNTETYKKLKKERLPVVKRLSLKHRLLFLHAEKLISSQTGIIFMNGLSGLDVFFRDLISFDYIHIQHGIAWQNMDHLLNANIENIKLMTSCAHAEYDNLSQEMYGYVHNQLKMSGMARFDGFEHRDKESKKILFCPTWRKELVGPLALDGKREYSEKFKESLFFKIYNDLFSDKEFIDKVESYGYKILFLLHPNMQTQRGDFTLDERIEFPDKNELDYDHSLKDAQIMITDYSGIQFDFAYMKKTIIYFHHKDLPNHLENSEFFNYTENGFGEICEDLESLKNEVFKAIRNEGKLTPKYHDRVSKFFIHDDYNNCKRIYEEITKL